MKLVPTVEQAWGAQKPSYYTVLVLDRVLREQLENIPVLLRLPLKSANEIPVSKSDSHSLNTFGPELQSKSYIPLEQYGLDWRTRTCLTMQRYTAFFLSHVGMLPNAFRIPVLFQKLFSSPSSASSLFRARLEHFRSTAYDQVCC